MIGIVIAAVVATSAARAEDLSWLSGRWLMQVGQQWTEERWASPRGGVLIGTGLSGRGDKATSFEFMRIASGPDGELAFWASPSGEQAVPFTLISLTKREAVFENPAHDFPKRIVYRRRGAVLEAELSGDQVTQRLWFERQR